MSLCHVIGCERSPEEWPLWNFHNIIFVLSHWSFVPVESHLSPWIFLYFSTDCWCPSESHSHHHKYFWCFFLLLTVGAPVEYSPPPGNIGWNIQHIVRYEVILCKVLNWRHFWERMHWKNNFHSLLTLKEYRSNEVAPFELPFAFECNRPIGNTVVYKFL